MFHSVSLLSQAPLARRFCALSSVLLVKLLDHLCQAILNMHTFLHIHAGKAYDMKIIMWTVLFAARKAKLPSGDGMSGWTTVRMETTLSY